MLKSDDKLIRVAAKMWNERAISVEDSEIERCLGGCVGRTKMIHWAKEARDCGDLTLMFINELE